MRKLPKVLAALATLVLLPLTPAPAVAGPPTTGTQPIYDYARAVREQVWVQTNVDSDSDGMRDRVAVRIIRPRASA